MTQKTCCVTLNFSKLKRLLVRREFRDVYQNGKKYVGHRLTFFYLFDEHKPPRLGITITKKWGKAHDRNRFKRVVREGFRLFYPSLKSGILLNVHPRGGYKDLTAEEVATELKQLSISFGQTQPKSAKSRCHD